MLAKNVCGLAPRNAPSSKLAAARWVCKDAHVDGLPETSDDACHRAMDWLLEVQGEFVRVLENTCGDTWPNPRRELEKIQFGSFSGPTGRFRQRTEVTPAQRAILGKLELAEPPRRARRSSLLSSSGLLAA